MKDTIITAKAKKREVIIFLSCLFFAYLMNIYAIITISGNWKELYSTLGYVLVIGLVIYLVLGILRIMITSIVSIFRKNSS